MDDEIVEKKQLVERYVFGQLSDGEAAEFEDYFISKPELVSAVEAAEQLQRGLRDVETEYVEVPEPTKVSSRGWSTLINAFKVPVPLYATLALVGLTGLLVQQSSEQGIGVAGHQDSLELLSFVSSANRNASGVRPYELTLDAGSKQGAIVVTVPESSQPHSEQQPLYQISLRSNEFSWQSPTFVLRSASNSQVIALPAKMRRGKYQITLHAHVGNESKIPVEHFCSFQESCSHSPQ